MSNSWHFLSFYAILYFTVLLSITGPPIVSEADVTLSACVTVLGTVIEPATLTLTTMDNTAKGIYTNSRGVASKI